MNKKLTTCLEILAKMPHGKHIEACKEFPVDVNCYDQYVFFDNAKYTRNLIAENDLFELMTICWEPGHETPIHDHSGSDGFMLLLQGQLQEVIYRQKDSESPVVEKLSRVLSVGESSVINEKIGLHKIVNKSLEKSISLHLYCKPIKKYFVYNERTPRRILKNTSFYSKYGHREIRA